MISIYKIWNSQCQWPIKHIASHECEQYTFSLLYVNCRVCKVSGGIKWLEKVAAHPIFRQTRYFYPERICIDQPLDGKTIETTHITTIQGNKTTGIVEYQDNKRQEQNIFGISFYWWHLNTKGSVLHFDIHKCIILDI